VNWNDRKEPSGYIFGAVAIFAAIQVLLILIRIILPLAFTSFPGWAVGWLDAVVIGWGINLVYVGITLVIYLVQRVGSDPSDHGFERLVRYLLSAYDNTASSDVIEEKQKEIRRIGAYCERTETKITVSDYDKATNSFKVEVRDIRHIKNLFKDVSFRNDDFDITVEPDPVDMELLGEVTVLSLTPDGGVKKTFIEDTRSIKLSDESKVYKAILDIDIPPRSKAIFDFNYNIRQLNNGPFWYSTKLYTPSSNILFKNLTGMPITVSVVGGADQTTPEPVVIENGSSGFVSVYSGPLGASVRKEMTISATGG